MVGSLLFRVRFDFEQHGFIQYTRWLDDAKNTYPSREAATSIISERIVSIVYE